MEFDNCNNYNDCKICGAEIEGYEWGEKEAIFCNGRSYHTSCYDEKYEDEYAHSN
jgi:hypothetical protein